MGKAQSKRSVDITTDVKKDDVLEEGTGKMGKIEDVDQLKPQVNGDTHHNETEANDKEKTADAEATENEKDLSTEKEQPAKIQTEGAEGVDTNASETNKTVENGNDETLDESKTGAATGGVTAAAAAAAESSTAGAENGDSNKKTKKEKLKKKWSFRSISFGKKDKQKPSKKDEETLNGECEKVPEENTEETAQNKNTDESPNENSAAESGAAEKSATENIEKTDEKKDIPAAAVNGTEEPIKNDSPAAASKSSDIVPAPEVTKSEVKDEKSTDKPVIAAEPPTDASILKAVETVIPAKIEEQPIPAPVGEIAAEVIPSEAVTVKQDESVPIVNPTENVIKTESNEEKLKEELKASQEVSPNVEKPTETEVRVESSDPKSVTEEKVQEPEIIAKPEANEPIVEPQAPVEQEQGKPEEKVVVESTTQVETPVVAKVEEKVESVKPAESPEAAPTEPSSQLPSEEKKVSEEPLKQEVEQPITSPEKSETLSGPKLENEINPEQIAQTIALIDEVTQDAAAAAQQILNSNEQSTPEDVKPTVEQKDELPKPELNDNTSPIEGNSVSTASETASTIDSQIPPAIASPNENLSTEKVGEEKIESDATLITAPNDSPIVKDNQDTNPKVDQSQKQSEQIQNESLPSVTEQVTTEVKEDVKSETSEDQKTKEAADPIQTATSKENGIGENHHDVTETSATESLNGQVEQKTAEEIKSEQQTAIDLKAEATPEVVPVAAE